MSQNKLTLQEKQMPSIRLPFRIAVFCCIDLFVAFIMVMVMLTENNFPGAIAASVVLGIPAIVGLAIYFNHYICFDKDHITYRNTMRRTHRYRLSQIESIGEGRTFTFLHISNKRIAVNKHSRNSHWLLELAGMKQNSEEPTKTTKKEERVQLISEIIIYSGIALIVAIGFTAISWFAWNDHASRFLVHFFALFAIGGYVTAIAIPLLVSPLNPKIQEDGSMKGRYLIHKDGNPASGVPDRYLIGGTLFFIAGFLLNVITIPLYLISVLCFMIFFTKEIIIRFLHRCPEWIVKRALKNHAPSDDLNALMPSKYDPYIDPNITLQWNNNTNEDSTESEEENTPGFGFIIISVFAAIIAIILLFNFYLHDSRFESTAELEVSFSYGAYENDGLAPFGKTFHLITTEEYFSTKDFKIKGFDQYGKNQELFRSELDGRTTFRITVSQNIENNEVEILSCKDEYGNVIFSESDCRTRNKKLHGTIMAGFIILSLSCFIIGKILSHRKKHIQPQENSSTKDFYDKTDKNNDLGPIGYAILISIAFLLIFLLDGNEKNEDLIMTEAQLTEYAYLHNIKDKLSGDAWLDLIDKEEQIYSINRFDLCGDNEELLLSKIEEGNTIFIIHGAIRDYGVYIYELSDDSGTTYITKENTLALIKKQEKAELRNNLLIVGGIIAAAFLYTLISRHKKKINKKESTV